ncbi:hypothetical protein BHS07_01870 [Myxococcus xanthus]|nr:hypothetical protein BHS07_01870 [Myxococcus xanthus]
MEGGGHGLAAESPDPDRQIRDWVTLAPHAPSSMHSSARARIGKPQAFLAALLTPDLYCRFPLNSLGPSSPAIVDQTRC